MNDTARTNEPGSRVASFSFKNIQVRTVDRDGQVWFVAGDVAKALGYADAVQMTRVLDEDEKGLHNVQTLGGKQQIVILSESGLYHALLKSRKPEARPFRKWVTAEVLPAIRKQGFYGQVPAMEWPIALYLPPDIEDHVVHASGLVESDSRVVPVTRRALLLGAEQDLLDIQRNRQAMPRCTGQVAAPTWIRLNNRHAMFSHVAESREGTDISSWLFADPFAADSIMFMRKQYYSMDFVSMIEEQGYSAHCLIRNFQ